MIKDDDIKINVKVDYNSFLYYKDIIYPILEDTYIYYYDFKNPTISFDRFKYNTHHIFNVLIENKNKKFIKFCNKALLDIFDFLTCDKNDFLDLQTLIIDDYNIIINNINKNDKIFLETLSLIFYYIIFFKKCFIKK